MNKMEAIGERQDERGKVVWVYVLIWVGILGMYLPAINAPFFYDDQISIIDNMSLRDLWAWPGPWWAVREMPTAGRPLVNFSFAVNYAIGGLEPWGYRLVNMVLHGCCSMMLFWVARRALGSLQVKGREGWGDKWGDKWRMGWAGWWGGWIAVWWAIHPLNTETVAYVTQRSEQLASLFLLLTLYGAQRGWGAKRPEEKMKWHGLAVGMCGLAALSKEIAVAGFWMVLFYDRCVVSGSWKQVFRRSKWLYVGLAATWLITLAILWSQPRPGSTGFGHGVSVWSYLKAQAISLGWYLKLSFLPEGMQIMYYWAKPPTLWEALPAGLLVVGLLGLSVWGIARGRAWGFVGGSCFVVLAPSSSFVPIITEVTADRRMYLPLMGVIALVVMGAAKVMEKMGDEEGWRRRKQVMMGVLVAVVMGMMWQGIERTLLYNDTVALWENVIEKEPDNHIARNNMASALMGRKEYARALEEAKRSLELRRSPEAYVNVSQSYEHLKELDKAIAMAKEGAEYEPRHSGIWNQLGLSLAGADRREEAIEAFKKAVETARGKPDPMANLGMTLSEMGRYAEAISPLEKAVKIKPESTRFRILLGVALLRAQRPEDAIEHLSVVVKKEPENGAAHADLAMALVQQERMREATIHYQRAVELTPEDKAAWFNLGSCLVKMQQFALAEQAYEKALELSPVTEVKVRLNLARVKLISGQTKEAETLVKQVLLVEAGNVEAGLLLADIWMEEKKLQEAMGLYEEILKQHQDVASVHHRYGVALARLGLMDQALVHFETAVKLAPDQRQMLADLERAKAILEKGTR